MNLNGILLGSEDPQGLVAYYTRLFGEPSWADEGYTGWQLGNGWLGIGFHDQVIGRSTHPGRIIWNIECTDVQGEFDRLVDAGAIVVREPYDPGGDGSARIATLADPDDNYFQLMSPMQPS